MIRSAPPFTEAELTAMKAILTDAASSAVRLDVESCLWQTARLAHLAACGLPFQAALWGLNLGRAQELLGSYGGAAAWWGGFGPLLEARNWVGLAARSIVYLGLLDLPLPDEAFLNRE